MKIKIDRDDIENNQSDLPHLLQSGLDWHHYNQNHCKTEVLYFHNLCQRISGSYLSQLF